MQVEFRRIGNFYHVFDDDIYILHYFFDYKINQGKCGFPKSAYQKVINILEEKKISYHNSYDHDGKDFKKKNKYQWYVEKGKKKVLYEERKNHIFEEAMMMTEQEVDELLCMMEKYICER